MFMTASQDANMKGLRQEMIAHEAAVFSKDIVETLEHHQRNRHEVKIRVKRRHSRKLYSSSIIVRSLVVGGRFVPQILWRRA